MEYESYYFVKFAKYPKITKKLSTQSGESDNFSSVYTSDLRKGRNL